MNHRSGSRDRAWLSAPLAAAVVMVSAVSAVAPSASAEPNAMSKVSAGLAYVTTNLGYQNAAAAGTGVVLTPVGEVLTNNHVIRGATTIKVQDVNNGHTYTATVVGYDVADDIAVLRLRGATGLRTAPVGNSTSVKVGAKVTAIGNAGGAGGTPRSVGCRVTALNTSITASDESGGWSEQLNGLIETDCALVAGMSGGPLASSAGKVVGLNTAASSGFEFMSGENKGFAIPMGAAMAIVRQIDAGHFSGNVHRGATAFLGLHVMDSGYVQNGNFHAGVLVVGVVPGSPAQKKGLGYGDVVTQLNGKSLASATALTNALLAMSPGAKVTLKWVDQIGDPHSATVTLGSGPPQ